MSEIESKVKAIIVDKLGVDEEEVRPEASFTNDLGADSLDTVELIMDFEKEFKSWIDENTCNDYCSASIRDTAEHFFELALNANHKQKA